MDNPVGHDAPGSTCARRPMSSPMILSIGDPAGGAYANHHNCRSDCSRRCWKSDAGILRDLRPVGTGDKLIVKDVLANVG